MAAAVVATRRQRYAPSVNGRALTPLSYLSLSCLLTYAVCLVGCGATSASAVRGLADAQAFERLHTALVGSWRTADGTVADYTLVSNDSALVESWASARGARTLTVYHPDGDGLLLTHYCAQGNQATLRVVSSRGAQFHFERERVTNRAPGQGVLTVLELSVEGDRLVRTETYVDDAGTPEVTVLTFERVPGPTP
jgi:hypothetical protein